MRKERGLGRLLALLLVAAPSGWACHAPARDAAPSPVGEDAEGGVPLEIANHNWSDMIIYVLSDGRSSRIGIATAASATSFVLPRRMLGQGGDLRLWGRPIGG